MEELMKNLDKKLRVTSYEYIEDILSINLERTNKSAICPHCGKKSINIHSRYTRTIKDLPIQEYKVELNIETKKKPKIGRNDPCTCGSGKKYKNCCGKNA